MPDGLQGVISIDKLVYKKDSAKMSVTDLSGKNYKIRALPAREFALHFFDTTAYKSPRIPRKQPG
jgi:hypothetical protein